MRIDNADLQGSVNLHKTITDIKSNPWNGVIVIADNVPHVIRGSNLIAYVEGTGTSYPGPLGTLNMHEIPLPETGSIQDAGSYGTSAYVLFSNGNLYTVGANTYGQLGVGDAVERNVYTFSSANVTRVFTSPSNANRNTDLGRLIIQRTDGKIYGCGYNEFGALGLNNTTITISSWTEMTWCGTSPRSVWNMGNYTGCTFCQLADGTVWAAGYNASGQLGNGSTANAVSTAVNVTNNWLGGTFAATGMVIQSVVGGYGFTDGTNNNQGNTTMFLDNGTASRIVSSGANNWNTLGDTTTTDRNTPVTASGFTGRVQQIGRMGDAPGAVYVLRTDGTVWNWGQNSSGQLGRNGTTNSGTPTQVLTGITRMLNENYTSYNYGYVTFSPIMESGSGYFIAGENGNAQLGVGDTTDRSVFTRMLFPSGTRLDKVGSMSTLNDGISRYATDTLGNFYAWGYNAYNAVIDSTTTNVAVPLRLAPSVLVR